MTGGIFTNTLDFGSRTTSLTQFYTEQEGWTDLSSPEVDPGHDFPCASFRDHVTGETIGVMLMGVPYQEGNTTKDRALIYDIRTDSWRHGPIFENEVKKTILTGNINIAISPYTFIQ